MGSAGAGNRSSVDESRSDGPEDETTVVEPEQGNGELPVFEMRVTDGEDEEDTDGI